MTHKKVNERHARVWAERRKGRKLREIAAEMGITSSRVRQMEIMHFRRHVGGWQTWTPETQAAEFASREGEE